MLHHAVDWLVLSSRLCLAFLVALLEIDLFLSLGYFCFMTEWQN